MLSSAVETLEEESMFSTWDRYPAAATRWLREATRRHSNPMGDFLNSLDVMIYAAGAAFALTMAAIVFD
jgi:hypothetical protein